MPSTMPVEPTLCRSERSDDDVWSAAPGEESATLLGQSRAKVSAPVSRKGPALERSGARGHRAVRRAQRSHENRGHFGVALRASRQERASAGGHVVSRTSRGSRLARRHRAADVVTAPRPYTLIAELTHRCPLGCPYCSNPTRFAETPRELS